MARHKNYDRLKVLEKSVDVFWEKGFKACSIADLVEATGLNTASMYKEFGDKDGLFEEALEHYRLDKLSPRLDALKEDPNLHGVKYFLYSVINGSSAKDYRGCLMMNHLSQKHSISQNAAGKLDDFCSNVENLLEKAFRNAQTEGDMPENKDPTLLASYITCFVHGLVLYGRHENKKKDIPKFYDILLQAILH